MKRIMFVCHGNICRSPMAEFIFKKLLCDRGMSSEYFVSSSATSAEEIFNGVGNPVYSPAVRELEKNGIFCGNKKAVQQKKKDYEKFDYFICMDCFNLRNAFRIFSSDPKGKLHKLMNFTKKGRDVDDPWYSGDFETAYKHISEGCYAFIDFLEK